MLINKSLKSITMMIPIIIGIGLSACNTGAQNLQQPQNNNLSAPKSLHQQLINSPNIESVIYNFGVNPNDGVDPNGLTLGTDGNFYGTTLLGGTNVVGAIVKVTPSGQETVLYTFGTNPNDGASPVGLTLGTDGDFYGTTFRGGTNNNGTIFKVTSSGQESVLYSFGINPNDGTYPAASLTLGTDGNFYGTTPSGGTNDTGIIFKVTPSGQESVLYTFGNNPNDGSGSEASLIQATDGNFYGVTQHGGTNNTGAIFKVTSSGQESVLYSFGNNLNDGAIPIGLTLRADGNFYGTTLNGGTNNLGTIFRVTPSGQESVLYSFGTNPNDGRSPLTSLTLGIDGDFYGTTQYGGTNNQGTVFHLKLIRVLYTFGTNPNDGVDPNGLTLGIDGNFYGTTSLGGTKNLGTIFKVTSSGQETILYSFTDGMSRPSSLTQGTDGDFYGTTFRGGTNNNGTIFKVTPSGQETVLYSFGNNPDGAFPDTSLPLGTDGNFYGATYKGGINYLGTIFRVTPSGQESVLYSFEINPNDGGVDMGMTRLTLGNDGDFYGTTQYGGINNTGMIFKVTPGGQESVLYTFGNNLNNGASPVGLTLGNDGNFYSTTFAGGTYSLGTIFKVTPTGQVTVLYSFGNNPNDGSRSEASLTLGTDGNFYGTTPRGGTNDTGIIFKVTPGGQETVLYSFGNSPNNSTLSPSSLILGTDGNFYGVTQHDGTNNMGTIYSLTW